MSSSTPLWTDQHDSTIPERQIDPAPLFDAYFEHVSEADQAELDPRTRQALVTTHVELAAGKGLQDAVVKVTPLRQYALVQIVHVLGNNFYVVFFFKFGQGNMRSIWLHR